MQLVTPKPEPKRDKWGRPYIIPAGGGKGTYYTRVTTYVKVLDDTYALQQWKMRMVALGLAARPDLLLETQSLPPVEDPAKAHSKRLNSLTDKALEAAKAGAAARTGTALHSLTELVDQNIPLPVGLTDGNKADLAAYQKATAHLKMVELEQFGCNDDLQVAGTWDRIVELDGRQFIADIKTGSTLDWAIGSIAQQLAVYAHCHAYDTNTGERTETGVYQNAGLIIHLPAGTGQCTLHWVDLAAGWEAVQLSAQVHAWRKRAKKKGELTRPYTPPAVAAA